MLACEPVTHEAEKRWSTESICGDTVVAVCHRPPSPLEAAKEAFLIPVIPETKLGLRWSMSSKSNLLLIKQIISCILDVVFDNFISQKR